VTAAGGEPVIQVVGVSRWFGDVVAVSDVSFEVGPGVTALLGPERRREVDAAAPAVRPDDPRRRGPSRVLGTDPAGDPSLYRRIGLVPQQEAVFERLSAARLRHPGGGAPRAGRPGQAGATRCASWTSTPPSGARSARTPRACASG
jgi:ABC-2 type transport system ATP-binding protein